MENRQSPNNRNSPSSASRNGNSKPVEILILEDNPADYEIIRRYLNNVERFTFHFHHVTNSKDALLAAEEESPDLLIIDHVLPYRDDFEFLRKLQNRNVYLPVIMVAGEGNDTLMSHSLRHGSDHYINKEDLSVSLLEESIDRVLNESQTKIKRSLKIIELKTCEDTNIDFLTGLNNRDALLDRLDHELKSQNEAHRRLSLIYLDVDQFERVNDRLGFETGDNLLKQIGAFLTSISGEEDFVARFKDDEFCLLFIDHHPFHTVQKAKYINNGLEGLFNQWSNNKTLNCSLSATLGVECRSPNFDDPEKFIDAAKETMQRAKSEDDLSVLPSGDPVSSYLYEYFNF